MQPPSKELFNSWVNGNKLSNLHLALGDVGERIRRAESIIVYLNVQIKLEQEDPIMTLARIDDIRFLLIDLIGDDQEYAHLTDYQAALTAIIGIRNRDVSRYHELRKEIKNWRP